MNKPLFWITGIIFLLILISGPGLSAQEDKESLSDWHFKAPISMEGYNGEPLVEFSIPPEIYKDARPTLSDFRVVDENNGITTGYVVRMKKNRSVTKPYFPDKIYNRSYVPGKKSVATADFGGKIMKNGVEIVTPGINFRRKVTIEASDNGSNWTVIAKGAFLFRISYSESRVFDKTMVRFPDNNQQYLRVTVYNGAGDPNKLEIKSIKCWAKYMVEQETMPIKTVSAKTEENKKITEIYANLEHSSVPLYKIKLAFEDSDFYRWVEVLGRDSETITYKEPTEGGPPFEKTVEAPWKRIKSTTIYRFSTGEDFDESLSINIDGARYRYLLIKVHNKDDQPLNFTGITATWRPQYIAFKPVDGGRMSLYFGNNQASRPSYDLGKFESRLREAGVFKASLGPKEALPASVRKEKEKPWSERNSALLWIVLIAGTLFLGYMVLRMLKNPAPSD